MPVLDYADAYAAAYEPYKGGPWCYEDGCLYRALVLLHQVTGEARWLDHLLRLTGPQIGPDGRLAGYRVDEYNIDNILAGRCLFHLDAVTGDPRYMRAAALLAGQLAAHPRTAGGNYWHKAIYPRQVWLDGLYMALPFQIEYAARTGEAALAADAVAQFETALRLTRRPDGLHAHGHDESRSQFWADPQTGNNADLWTRSLGWLAMALADAADLLGDDGRSLRGHLRELLERLEPLRAPQGLWYQVPDRPDLPGNYLESSASAMLAYAGLVAARIGVSARAAAMANGTLDALVRLMLRPAAGGGGLQLEGICAVAGLGGNGLRRDGTAAYYVSEPVVADDPKGVGPFLMATAERLRAQRAALPRAAAAATAAAPPG